MIDRYTRPEMGHIFSLENKYAIWQEIEVLACEAQAELGKIGISKEEQKHIFQRFYQVDPSRSGEGTGLGLSMVQQIAEFHNGTVTVKSAPGDGSIFTVLMFL